MSGHHYLGSSRGRRFERVKMIDRFEIIDHVSPRPDAEHILFCDGTKSLATKLHSC